VLLLWFNVKELSYKKIVICIDIEGLSFWGDLSPSSISIFWKDIGNYTCNKSLLQEWLMRMNCKWNCGGFCLRTRSFFCKDITDRIWATACVRRQNPPQISFAIIPHQSFLGRDFYAGILHNIFQNMEIDEGERSASKREPFYIYAYNNLFVRSSLTLNHNNNTSDLVERYNVGHKWDTQLHPYSYMYNNVFFAMPTAEGSFPIENESAPATGIGKSSQYWFVARCILGRNLFNPFMKSE